MKGCGYSAESLAARVYRVVQAQGQAGITLRDVHRAIGGVYEDTAKALYRLKRVGYLDQPGEGYNRPYVVTPMCKAMVLRGQELPALLALIEDCPAGVSVRLLVDETGLSARQVMRLLEPLATEGSLRRIVMPRSAGGGIGFRLPSDAEAVAMSTEAVKPIPAEAKPAVNVRAALLLGGRLSLDLPGMSMVMPPEVTRALFAELDRLQGIERGAAS